MIGGVEHDLAPVVGHRRPSVREGTDLVVIGRLEAARTERAPRRWQVRTVLAGGGRDDAVARQGIGQRLGVDGAATVAAQPLPSPGMTGPEHVRVGFLGAGLIAHYHALQLSRCAVSPEAVPHEVVAVYDSDPARAAGFAEGWGCEAVATSTDLVGALRRRLRLHVDGRAPRRDPRGCDGRAGRVLREAPLGRPRHASEAVALVESTGVVNMTGLVLRSSPAMAVAREMIADPTAGRVMNVVFRDDQYLPTQGMYASTWRGDASLAGSGVLMEHSIHDVDLVEWLVGPIDSVSAHQSSFHGIDGIEDNVSVVARFVGGATGVLATVWHDVMSRPSQRRIEVVCESAMITIEGDTFGPVHCERSDGIETVGADDLVEWMAARGIASESAETTFLRAVRDPSGGRPRPDVRDALRAHVLVDAIYRSAQASGAPIGIPEAVGTLDGTAGGG